MSDTCKYRTSGGNAKFQKSFTKKQVVFLFCKQIFLLKKHKKTPAKNVPESMSFQLLLVR